MQTGGVNFTNPFLYDRSEKMKKVFFTILVILLVLGAFLLGKNFDQKDLKENNEENKVTKEENNIAIPSYALSLLSNFDFSMNKSSITGFNDMDKYLFSKDKITKDDLKKILISSNKTFPSFTSFACITSSS